MILNLNSTVKVKLTSRGELLLAQSRIQEHKEMQSSLERSFAGRISGDAAGQLRVTAMERKLLYLWKDHPEDTDGYREFQLYELVSIFGKGIADDTDGKVFENSEIVFEEARKEA